MTSTTTISHHLLRRRARAKADSLNGLNPPSSPAYYRVVKTARGPWRWRVVKVVVER